MCCGTGDAAGAASRSWCAERTRGTGCGGCCCGEGSCCGEGCGRHARRSGGGSPGRPSGNRVAPGPRKLHHTVKAGTPSAVASVSRLHRVNRSWLDGRLETTVRLMSFSPLPEPEQLVVAGEHRGRFVGSDIAVRVGQVRTEDAVDVRLCYDEPWRVPVPEVGIRGRQALVEVLV